MIDSRPDRLPRPAQAVPRRFPAAAARARPVPAQPQPVPHRPRPLQARGHRAARQRRRGDQRDIPVQNERGEHIHYLRVDGAAQPGSAGDLQQPPDDATATAPTARRSGPRTWPRACPASTPASAARGSRPRSIRTRPTNRLQRTDRRQRRKSDGDFFERLKKFAFAGPDQHRLDPRPRLHSAGPVQADLRQRAGNHLPAHVRTDGRVAVLRDRVKAGLPDPSTLPDTRVRIRRVASHPGYYHRGLACLAPRAAVHAGMHQKKGGLEAALLVPPVLRKCAGQALPSPSGCRCGRFRLRRWYRR